MTRWLLAGSLFVVIGLTFWRRRFQQHRNVNQRWQQRLKWAIRLVSRVWGQHDAQWRKNDHEGLEHWLARVPLDDDERGRMNALVQATHAAVYGQAQPRWALIWQWLRFMGVRPQPYR